jgi:hypothetical protein
MGLMCHVLKLNYPLKDQESLCFWIGCYECNKFLDFLKLYEAVDMDGSFQMGCYTSSLDSLFKSYEVFKISAKVWTCCQLLPM